VLVAASLGILAGALLWLLKPWQPAAPLPSARVLELRGADLAVPSPAEAGHPATARSAAEPTASKAAAAEPTALSPTGPPTRPGPVGDGPSSRASPPPERPAWVILASDPPAEVHLDGRRLGVTPLPARRIRPGRHRAVFVHPVTGRRTKVPFTARAGKRRRIFRVLR
jgi:serine/threonine-protein kinase